MNGPINVYHWTTKERFESIKRTGLRKLSFVCKRPDIWHGEICLEISGMTDWDDSEPGDWQALTKEIIPPERIKIYSK